MLVSFNTEAQPEMANQYRCSKVSTRCAPGTGTGEGDAGSQVLDMGRRRGAAAKVPRITKMRRAPGLVLVVVVVVVILVLVVVLVMVMVLPTVAKIRRATQTGISARRFVVLLVVETGRCRIGSPESEHR